MCDLQAGVSGVADIWPLSARDAAAALGISERTVRRAISRGELAAQKHGGVFRIDPADLACFGRLGRTTPGATHKPPGIKDESTALPTSAGNLSDVLSAIHALTGPDACRAVQRDLTRTIARQWAVLTVVQRLCESALVSKLTRDSASEVIVLGGIAVVEAGPGPASAQFEIGTCSKDGSRSAGVVLTRREIDVLHRVVLGESNREIADSLFISIATVKRHLTTIFGKLGASSRHEAVLLARTHGLTQPPGR